MKLYKTLIFIFAIMAMLGCLALFFPEEGLQIGSFNLQFPNLREALRIGDNDEEEDEELTPEQLLEMRMASLMQAQDSAFLDFCQHSPIRIAMPRIHQYRADTLTFDQYMALTDSVRQLCDSIVMQPDSLWVAYRDSITDECDMAYLDTFFEALDSASTQHVRIVHYGDSQLEEDRITSGLREHFQAQFGGGGCGMMPAQKWVYKMTCSQSTSPELPYYLAYGPSSMRASHNGYGPMATVAHVNGTVRISYSMSNSERFPHVRDFNRVSVLRNDPETGSLQYLTQEFDSMQHQITVTVNGPADIYGVLLDQKTGVSMDNVPMRGSSGSIFTRIARKTIEPFFQHENVALIILQYGGNSVPAMKTEKSLHIFCREIQRQVKFFKEIAPHAKILFIGPSDMSTNIGGQMRTYPLLPQFVDLLEQYLTECGAAFWNMYEAMGGENSMVQWVQSRPQLAGEDYVHFTHKGAEHVSDLLYETIDTYYKYYKFRRGEFEIEIPEDDDETDSLEMALHADSLADPSWVE